MRNLGCFRWDNRESLKKDILNQKKLCLRDYGNLYYIFPKN